MYKIGDFAVYRLLNVCKIIGIETPDFEPNKEKRFYKLAPAVQDKSDTVIYVPVEGADNLRPLFTLSQIETAFKEIAKIKPTPPPSKKPAQQTAYYQDILATCNPTKYLALLKEIHVKEKSNTKRLSEIDNRFRTKTERLLCEEFSIVLQKTPEEIQQKLDAAIQ